MYKVFWNDPSNSCGGCFHTTDYKTMMSYIRDLVVDCCDFTVYHDNDKILIAKYK